MSYKEIKIKNINYPLTVVSHMTEDELLGGYIIAGIDVNLTYTSLCAFKFIVMQDKSSELYEMMEELSLTYGLMYQFYLHLETFGMTEEHLEFCRDETKKFLNEGIVLSIQNPMERAYLDVLNYKISRFDEDRSYRYTSSNINECVDTMRSNSSINEFVSLMTSRLKNYGASIYQDSRS